MPKLRISNHIKRTLDKHFLETFASMPERYFSAPGAPRLAETIPTISGGMCWRLQ